MSPIDHEQSAALRRFAVAANNEAWELLERPARSPEETDLMLDAAHAAAWHWRRIGGTLQHLRAQYLLATAHAAAGTGTQAIRHAHAAFASMDAAGAEINAFDRAAVHGSCALAYALLGSADQAQHSREEYRMAAQAIEEASERDLLMQLYGE